MIEPVRSGPDLLEEMDATNPLPGALAVWWLGQSGFLIKSCETTLLIDPYLSDHLTTKYRHTDRPHVRMTRAPLRGAELSGIDLVLASHKHSDHLDPDIIIDLLKASPQARLLLPRSLQLQRSSRGRKIASERGGPPLDCREVVDGYRGDRSGVLRGLEQA